MGFKVNIYKFMTYHTCTLNCLIHGVFMLRLVMEKVKHCSIILKACKQNLDCFFVLCTVGLLPFYAVGDIMLPLQSCNL